MKKMTYFCLVFYLNILNQVNNRLTIMEQRNTINLSHQIGSGVHKIIVKRIINIKYQWFRATFRS